MLSWAAVAICLGSHRRSCSPWWLARMFFHLVYATRTWLARMFFHLATQSFFLFDSCVGWCSSVCFHPTCPQLQYNNTTQYLSIQNYWLLGKCQLVSFPGSHFWQDSHQKQSKTGTVCKLPCLLITQGKERSHYLLRSTAIRMEHLGGSGYGSHRAGPVAWWSDFLFPGFLGLCSFPANNCHW